jgi:hypothetical protein
MKTKSALKSLFFLIIFLVIVVLNPSIAQDQTDDDIIWAALQPNSSAS